MTDSNSIYKKAFLTTKELEERWLVSRMTISRMRKRKAIKTHMVGRNVRFLMADILEAEQKFKV